MDALGQELTCFGYILFELATDNDSYALVILPENQMDEFKVCLKSRKQKGTQRKQARRKVGTPAKKIVLGKRLPCDKISLAAGYKGNLITDCIDGIRWLDYSMDAGARTYCSAALDINEWPPRQNADVELLVHNVAKNPDGLYAALVQSNLSDEKGCLIKRDEELVIGSDITKIKEWKCVYQEQNLEWSEMIWFEGELFAADRSCVYRIRNVTDSANSHEKVLELKEGDIRWYPKFFILGDRLHLFMHQSIYAWGKKDGLFRKGSEFKKVYTIDGFNAWDFAPVGDTRVAFQVRPKYISRGGTESSLTVLDITTGTETCYPCHYGYVQKWKDNRICVLPMDVKSKMPIMECFDFDLGEKRNLMYGALGKELVHNIYETACGTVLEGNGKNIYRTTQLWEFMENEKAAFGKGL